jgi:hypothetical protein
MTEMNMPRREAKWIAVMIFLSTGDYCFVVLVFVLVLRVKRCKM